MIEAAAIPSYAVALLVVVSFCSFIIGAVFRKWPEKVQEYTAELDGSALFLRTETHRLHIQLSGVVLTALSVVALAAAGMLG